VLLLNGLYKFWFKTFRGTGCGVMFATESGRLQFIWEEDGGAVYTLEAPLTVRG